MSGEVLLPCPFCGSTDIDAKGWMNGEGKTGPECEGCGATAESVDLWNTRPLATEGPTTLTFARPITCQAKDVLHLTYSFADDSKVGTFVGVRLIRAPSETREGS
jgi:hypothetical protein